MDIISQIVDTLIVLLQSEIVCEMMQADDIYIFESVDSKITIKLDIYKDSIIDSGLEYLCK